MDDNEDLTRDAQDILILDQWKQTGDKKHFQQLYRNMAGTLAEAAKKASMGSNLPKAAFKLEAAHQFHLAINRYVPNKGTKLSSFVYGAVEDKLKRINYKYQNLARRPERAVAGVYHVNQFNNEKLFLHDKLGREPSAGELSDAMGWSVKQVEMMLLENRRDLSLNAELEDLNVLEDFASDNDVIAMHYYDMNPEQQLVFDYATGSHGKSGALRPNGTADFKAIAQKLGWPESKVAKIRNQITKKFKSI